MNQRQYSDLQAVFGDTFLRYVLNLETTDELDANVLQNFDADRNLVLISLQHFIDMSSQGASSTEGIAWRARMQVDRYVTESNTAIANLMRLQTGGDIPTTTSSTNDSVLAGLTSLLADVYPSLLLPRGEIGLLPPMSRIAFQHPSRSSLEAAVVNDPALSKLYSVDDPSSGQLGYAYRSTGQGGTVQLAMFGSQQIALAYTWASLESDSPSIDNVAVKLQMSLHTLRRAIRGEEATIPVRVGITGVLLPASLNDLDLGWARLRRPNANDREIARRTGLAGTLQASQPDGTVVSIDYSGDVVLVMDVPYKVVLGKVAVDAPWPTSLSQLQDDAMRTVETLRLGLVLALNDDWPAVVVQSWRLVIDPLAPAALPSWRDRRVSNLQPRQLTEAEVVSWEIWAQRVKSHRTPSIAIALRRVLQALAERDSPEDVLVDAVIVWENLFGAAPETTHRVSTALAWLLGEDATARVGLQKQYKEIYALRSQIVHGAPTISKSKVNEIPRASRAAVNIAVDALRKLFEARTDLLHESDSAKRGDRLLLDLHP